MNLVGRTISHFRVLAKIGEGGMGQVYEAEDTKLRRRVALKVLSPQWLGVEERRRRLLREARAAAAVSHPNIAVVHEVDEVEDVAFIAMERLAGPSLRAHLAQGRLGLDEAVRIAVEIARGLDHAHRAHVVHRDLKPENVMVAADGGVKILDFGLAKVLPHFEQASTSATTIVEGPTVERTREGMFAGTLDYASPEQLRGQALDARSDLFSLGVLLHEMVTGVCPFRRPTAVDTASAILNDVPPPPSRSRPGVSPALDRIVASCLVKDPAQRCPSAAVLLREFEALLEAGPRAAARPRWRGWLVALLLTGLAGAIAVRYLGDGVPARRSVAVVGFKNLSGDAGSAWLSTALAEMLTTELAAGPALRTIPGENVARMKVDLAVADEPAFGRETLARIRGHLGADLVVLGAFVALGQAAGGRIRVDLRLQDTRDGETLASVVETGTESGLFDLVAAAGARLRAALGVTVAAAQASALHSALPVESAAVRLYAEGLEKLRSFQALAAREPLERSAALEPERAATHVALARVWELLGYEERQRESAARAFALSADLPREARLAIEAGHRQAQGEWDRALEVQRSLCGLDPENVDYALSLARFQTLAGKGKETLATIAELRRHVSAAADDPRVDLAEAAAANSLSDSKLGAAAAGRAAARAASAGARLVVAQAQAHQAWALIGLGQDAAAWTLLEQARDTLAAAGDRAGVAQTLTMLGRVLRGRGEYAAAIESYERGLGVFREIGSRRSEAGTLNDLANVHYRRGDLAQARSLYELALEVNREIGNRTGVPHQLGNLANLLYDQGDLPGAQALHEQALAAFEDIGHQGGAARTLANIGAVLLDRGDVARAHDTFEMAIARERDLDLRHDLPQALLGLGDVLLAGDDLDGARRSFEEARVIREELGQLREAQAIRLALGLVLLEEERTIDAERTATEVAEYFSKNEDDRQRMRALLLQAEALRRQGRLTESRRALDGATALDGDPTNRAELHALTIAAARVRAASGEAEWARQRLLTTRAELEQRGFVGLAFEARLAEGQIAVEAGDVAGGRARLAALERQAAGAGFQLVARKCRSAGSPPGG